MRKSAAVLCQDKASLETLQATLSGLGVEVQKCRTEQEALEFVLAGRCATLIVDFDLPDAEGAIRMAKLLPPAQKPALFALESRTWLGTGQAFQSGANRILYKPIDPELIKDAFKTGRKTGRANRRKSERHDIKTLVYLDLPTGTLPGVSLDIGEHGLAVHAIERVPMGTDLAFRCVLPGSHVTLQGRADVIWASDEGRAGLFFSKLAPATRKQLKNWISRQSRKHAAIANGLLPPADVHVDFAPCEDELVEAL